MNELSFTEDNCKKVKCIRDRALAKLSQTEKEILGL